MPIYLERQCYRFATGQGGVNANGVLETPAAYGGTSAPGHDGAGVTLCCLLESWEQHHDLPAVGSGPTTTSDALDRGVGILGILLGKNDADGFLGVARGAYPPDASAPVPPRVRSIPPPGSLDPAAMRARGQAIARAIRDAVREIPLGCGDVLLIDAQTETRLPVETFPDVYKAICLAVELGVVVVEPAGDAAVNGACVDGALPGVPSGALIVGALNLARSRDPRSNYGTRVQLCALGAEHQVYSLSSGGGHGYMGPFPTRVAAAVIAGAAASAEGMALACAGARLAPAQLAHLLRDCGVMPVYGGPVGRMPDLLRVYGRLLDGFPRGVPDAYMRDFSTDNGDSDPEASLSLSPDIDVVLHGQPTALLQSSGGGPCTVARDAPNDVYVGLQNRGRHLLGDPAMATKVKAHVYWSPRTSLSAPTTWNNLAHLVGIASVDAIPAGDRVVLGPIQWTPPATLPPREVSLIAVIGSPEDPAPVLADLPDDAGFVRMVRGNNNIAWRICPVVSGAPA